MAVADGSATHGPAVAKDSTLRTPSPVLQRSTWTAGRRPLRAARGTRREKPGIAPINPDAVALAEESDDGDAVDGGDGSDGSDSDVRPKKRKAAPRKKGPGGASVSLPGKLGVAVKELRDAYAPLQVPESALAAFCA